MLDFIGQMIGGWLGYKGQKDTNEANIQLGREQMDFQREMSNTAYTRAVTDMKNAGLNPMLAYQQGGASTPQGAMPQVQNKIGAAVSTAKQGADTALSLQQMAASKAQIEQTEAQTKQIESVTLDNSINAAAKLAEIDNLRARTTYQSGPQSKLTEQDYWLRRAQTDTALSAAQRENYLALSEGEKYNEMKKQNGWAADVQKRKYESALTGLEIPKSKAEANFYEGLGKANPYLAQILMLLKGGSSARQIIGK